jgi:hypothetical protein
MTVILNGYCVDVRRCQLKYLRHGRFLARESRLYVLVNALIAFNKFYMSLPPWFQWYELIIVSMV